MTIRELTAKEKRELRRMIKAMCANYDSDYGCLLLDSACFMLGKAYTGGALCKWFRNALMPLYSEIGQLFEGGIKAETKPCQLCGRTFALNGRQVYCSAKCVKEGNRKSDAERSQRYRRRKRGGERVTN